MYVFFTTLSKKHMLCFCKTELCERALMCVLVKSIQLQVHALVPL